MSSWERAVIGLVAVALIAIAAMAVGRDIDRLRRLALATTLLTLVLVVFGAVVRLSDAGLGCPDWPGCYGNLSPSHAESAIRAAQESNPVGPVSMSKAWKEMSHRYLAMIVGCLIFAMAVAAGRQQPPRRGRPLLAWSIGLLVIAQASLGALTVTLLLKPVIVSLHLVGGMLILFALVWYLQSISVPPPRSARIAHLRWPARIGLLLLLIQICLGGWVSTNYAAAVCGDLPTCQQQWWPPTQFEPAFRLLRELGKTADGEMLGLPALTAIHMAHRMFAVVALCFLLWLAWRVFRTPASRLLGLALAGLVLMQVLLGLVVVASMAAGHPELQVQLPAAAAHNAGAALLIVTLAVINFRVTFRSIDSPTLQGYLLR